MKTIVLTGMMGSGKTSIGKLLAKKFNLHFADIDNLIELQENMSISEIFALKGEEYFRNIEKDIIKNIFKNSNLVIALGGGAFENKQTRNFLLENSSVIYLQTEAETIFQRLKNDDTRPLLCGNMSIEKITEIIEQRKHNYQTASYIITTDNKNPDTIVEEITGVLK